MRYAISRVKDFPATPVPFFPIEESRERILAFCRGVNERHARARTGEVYKVFVLDESEKVKRIQSAYF